MIQIIQYKYKRFRFCFWCLVFPPVPDVLSSGSDPSDYHGASLPALNLQKIPMKLLFFLVCYSMFPRLFPGQVLVQRSKAHISRRLHMHLQFVHCYDTFWTIKSRTWTLREKK